MNVNAIKEIIRVKFGTQQNFAAVIGMNTVSVSRILNGKQRLGKNACELWSLMLGQPMEALRDAHAGQSAARMQKRKNVSRKMVPELQPITPDTLITCKPYSCTMAAKWCLCYQDTARENVRRQADGVEMLFAEFDTRNRMLCANCAQGKVIAASVQQRSRQYNQQATHNAGSAVDEKKNDATSRPQDTRCAAKCSGADPESCEGNSRGDSQPLETQMLDMWHADGFEERPGSPRVYDLPQQEREMSAMDKNTETPSKRVGLQPGVCKICGKEDDKINVISGRCPACQSEFCRMNGKKGGLARKNLHKKNAQEDWLWQAIQDRPDLYDRIATLARDQERTPERQAIWMLRQAVGDPKSKHPVCEG